MMNWKGQSLFAACAVFAILLFVADEADARRGGGRDREVSRSGPASSGSIGDKKSTHQENRSDAQSNRNDNRSDARDDRNDRYDDRRDDRNDRYDDRRDYRDDVRDDRQDYYDDRQRRRLGATLTRSAFRSLSCKSTKVIVGNVTYYRCGNDWYSRAYQGSSVTYVIVTAPAGY